ncbi:MAG: putative phosphotransferase, aminoglycoside/choline kinase (APH/ChoK) family [Candidatus Midichloria mitochondrii]
MLALKNLPVANHIIEYCNRVDLLRGAEISIMGRDCSTKSHYRATLKDGRSYVIMDASGDSGVADSLVRVHNFMNLNEFSAPKIFDYNKQQSLVITEDFGDNSYKNILLNDPSLELQLYYLAIQVLGKINSVQININLPNHDADSLNKALLKSFYNCYKTRMKAGSELFDVFSRLFSKLSVKNSLVLRDYHIDNMVFLEERESYKKVGLVDIQDASIGHPVYDLVSLLEDARRDVSSEVVKKCKEYFLQLCPTVDINEFNYSYGVLGLQRSLRILWLFSYLKELPSKERYGQFLPRVKNYVRDKLKNPIFKEILVWSDKHQIPLHD